MPGGGGMRENSVAREERGVCFGESVTRMFVSSARRPTKDCGVMSWAYAIQKWVNSYEEMTSQRTLCFGCEEDDVVIVGFVVRGDGRTRVFWCAKGQFVSSF